jgi:hypothetical protein
MLYRGYIIQIIKVSELYYRSDRELFRNYPYVYQIRRLHTLNIEYDMRGASTARIAFDLAKFTIDLWYVNEERIKKRQQRIGEVGEAKEKLSLERQKRHRIGFS